MIQLEDSERGPTAIAFTAGLGFMMDASIAALTYAERFHASRIVMLAGLAGLN